MPQETKKLLVAEDDKFLTRIYQLKLEKEGYDMALASDGSKVLDMAKKEKPGLILLDILMPKKNGFEVLEELQSDPDLKEIPVIIVSNLGQDDDVKKGIDSGAVDYIIKADTEIDDIIAKIEKHMK